jgi:simple sugar transport system substrate-binding protein
MITLDGATLLFPTSFGYFDPHVLKVATQYPKVTFLHAGGLYQEGKHPKNVGSYFGYIDEAQYLAGIVAGHTSRSSKLGFVGYCSGIWDCQMRLSWCCRVSCLW